MPLWDRVFGEVGLQFAYFSGAAQISEWRNGGAGVILRFQRVRPPRAGAFQPLRSDEISPDFLDRAIRALRKWNFDFLTLDEVKARAERSALTRRFVCLTFDGGYRDFMTFAYPVLSRHRVPFAVYVPTGFIDGLGEAWWLALEQIVDRNPRIGLMIGDVEQRLGATTTDEKYQLYAFLYEWLRGLVPADLSAAIGDLCRRYDVDLKAVSRDLAMTWADLAKLTRDPQATIGSATVHYPVLAHAKGSTVLREMAMGRSVLEAGLGSECRHFAYPFGDRDSFGTRDVLLAQEAGFVTAVSGGPGVIRADGKSNPLSLPRIAWDGRLRSMGALRTILSGLTLRRERDKVTEPDADANYG